MMVVILTGLMCLVVGFVLGAFAGQVVDIRKRTR